MTITPRGLSFMVSVGSGKDRQRVTVKTEAEALKVEADLIEAQAKARIKALEAAQRGDSTKTLQDAFDRAYRDSWKGSKGERTTLLNAKDVLALLRPDTPVTAIDSDAIDELMDKLDDRGLSGATINRKVAVLSVMLRAAEEKGWLSKVPRLKRRLESGGRIFWYTEAEEAAMLEACQYLGLPDLTRFIRFAIRTGFRRSELLRLLVSDVEGGAIRLHHGETKNGHARTIPTTETTEAIVNHARQQGHTRVFQDLTDAILRNQWDALCAHLGKADDPKYIVHVLRHTTATRLAIGGATGFQIMAFMGHQAIQTSMRYVHLAGGQLTGVANILEPMKATRPPLRVVNGGLYHNSDTNRPVSQL